MEAIAKVRNLKGSPQKTRLVIDLIRGRDVAQALAILQFTNKRATKPIAKVLRSAIANATYKAEQENIAIDPDDLWIKSCFVDMGVHKNRRRLRPAPQGRAYQEQRHYCHITITVSTEGKPEEKEYAPKVKAENVDAGSTKEKKTKLAKPTAQAKIDEKPEKSAKEMVKEDKTEKIKVESPPLGAEVAETADIETAEGKTLTAEEIENIKENTVASQLVIEKLEGAKLDPTEENTEASKEVFEKKEGESLEPGGEPPFDDKPLAAQTAEEKTGTKMEEDAKIDKVEELERQ